MLTVHLYACMIMFHVFKNVHMVNLDKLDINNVTVLFIMFKKSQLNKSCFLAFSSLPATFLKLFSLYWRSVLCSVQKTLPKATFFLFWALLIPLQEVVDIMIYNKPEISSHNTDC